MLCTTDQKKFKYIIGNCSKSSRTNIYAIKELLQGILNEGRLERRWQSTIFS